MISTIKVVLPKPFLIDCIERELKMAMLVNIDGKQRVFTYIKGYEQDEKKGKQVLMSNLIHIPIDENDSYDVHFASKFEYPIPNTPDGLGIIPHQADINTWSDPAIMAACDKIIAIHNFIENKGGVITKVPLEVSNGSK